jgi:formylglycine-generating enzyme required for sulfatase activity
MPAVNKTSRAPRRTAPEKPADIFLTLGQPYPGLRPFEPDEAVKFYGRETHTTDLLQRLAENPFLAVIGSSGTGKSSLVRAGLLPALHRGRLAGATSQWRICIMRPGDAPMTNLANSLAKQNIFSNDSAAVLKEVERSSLGLARLARNGGLAPGESLLLVVDQFEELFRFVRERKRQDGGAEARLFVASVIEAADFTSAPVYVVLTMRSDFLGDCIQFQGLPEALNRSQYLVPRMSRGQIRDGIEKPLRLTGAKISARLVEQLLNELGDDTDQLPVLQHALNRIFHEFQERGGKGEIGVRDYKAAGGLSGSLNQHAEAILEEATQEDRSLVMWTERVFRCLTAEEGGRRIRRPTRLDRICGIVGAGTDETRSKVRRVVEAYSHRDRAMLVWTGEELGADSVIDISHESLIEHWGRLKDWVKAETEATSLFRSAAEDATRSSRGAAAKWRSLKLIEAAGYLRTRIWNEVWAERLVGDGNSFAVVRDFIGREFDDQNREEREAKVRQSRDLQAERQAKELAEEREHAARRAKELAEASERAARREKEAALAREEVERQRTELAEEREREALRAREDAEARAALEERERAAAEALAASERAAREAAEARAVAERQKRRWIKISFTLVVLVLALGAAVLWVLLGKAKSDTAVAQAALQSQTDNTLALLDAQVRSVHQAMQSSDDQYERAKAEVQLAGLLKRVDEAIKVRNAATATLNKDPLNRTQVNSIDGLTYVAVPPGSFTFGCSTGDTDCQPNEFPAQPGTAVAGFWLGQTEVTQPAWDKVMKRQPPGNSSVNPFPVRVDWNQAQEYCAAIGGRLPSEKEWEYAERGKTMGARYGPLVAVAWYLDNSDRTSQRVSLRVPNDYGLFDMLGNLWEWTSDSYDKSTKVIRGGSFRDEWKFVRASVREGLRPDGQEDRSVGFRCVTTGEIPR